LNKYVDVARFSRGALLQLLSVALSLHRYKYAGLSGDTYVEANPEAGLRFGGRQRFDIAQTAAPCGAVWPTMTGEHLLVA
jgi:hypothetical protein